MSDKFNTISLNQLMNMILKEFQYNKSIFGIPSERFFKPTKKNPFQTQQFNQILDTPLGVAAGPHTQMAQNIVASWLVGARYIELKTIQTLDELDIAKPCIDMQDEGYNCEWSQELKIKESFNEYLNAWIIIHILHHKLGFYEGVGTIFNMSVGYNMDGILKPNVQWFFEKMLDCTAELKEKILEIKDLYPLVEKINIPVQISNNITLSTMHGCPADEIEEIGCYLLKNKKLHTFIKLNPTLLGPEKLREILNSNLNFKTIVPDEAFHHDLKYSNAIKIIHTLKEIADKENLQFGLKLTNTLEAINHKTIFDSEIEMMYMSGRALHPISINLANKLQDDFKGNIVFSFSAGVDAFNVSDTLASGFSTITICSDLLKPGGYMRLHQYFEELNKNFELHHAKSIEEFILNKNSTLNVDQAKLINLKVYAAKVLKSERYKRTYLNEPNIKTDRNLDYFDCISAPCLDTCATHQDIPNYLFHASKGNFDKAYQVILETNPLPSITGLICDHLCQYKCTRVHYDDAILIKEVKRFISEQQEIQLDKNLKNNLKVAIIGAGPSGMTCAYYLALAGFSVDIFEAHAKAGGMIQYAIPGFRVTDQSIEIDFKRITDLGVKIYYNHKIDQENFNQLLSNYNYLYVGVGAQLSSKLEIDGNNAKGIIEPLKFLFDVKAGFIRSLGHNVIIIGGGNTAMDAARTANRLVGDNGQVHIVYRRTKNEMPADELEVQTAIEEGVNIIELTAPESIIVENEQVTGLKCSKMMLSEKDASGRPKSVKIPDSEFVIYCDTIIPAIGQNRDIDFIPDELLIHKTAFYQTKLENVFIGGDALRGASSAINAIGDGRKVAFQIIQKSELDFKISTLKTQKNISYKDLILKRSKRMEGAHMMELPFDNRKNFKLISQTLDRDNIISEADRCLYCDEICNICTTVCPNFANYAYKIDPVQFDLKKIVQNENGNVKIIDDKSFKVSQSYQILNIDNFCNDCGNCDTFCPTKSAPYLNKPKIHLTKKSFETSAKGFFLDKNQFYFKENNDITTLVELADKYILETKDVIINLDKLNFKILEVKPRNKHPFEYELSLAAQMSVVLKGVQKLM